MFDRCRGEGSSVLGQSCKRQRSGMSGQSHSHRRKSNTRISNSSSQIQTTPPHAVFLKLIHIHVFVQTDCVHISPPCLQIFLFLSWLSPRVSDSHSTWRKSSICPNYRLTQIPNRRLTQIPKISPRSAGRARAAFCLLFLLLLAGWSSLLIGDISQLFLFLVKISLKISLKIPLLLAGWSSLLSVIGWAAQQNGSTN